MKHLWVQRGITQGSLVLHGVSGEASTNVSAQFGKDAGKALCCNRTLSDDRWLVKAGSLVFAALHERLWQVTLKKLQ